MTAIQFSIEKKVITSVEVVEDRGNFYLCKVGVEDGEDITAAILKDVADNCSDIAELQLSRNEKWLIKKGNKITVDW